MDQHPIQGGVEILLVASGINSDLMGHLALMQNLHTIRFVTRIELVRWFTTPPFVTFSFRFVTTSFSLLTLITSRLHTYLPLSTLFIH